MKTTGVIDSNRDVLDVLVRYEKPSTLFVAAAWLAVVISKPQRDRHDTWLEGPAGGIQRSRRRHGNLNTATLNRLQRLLRQACG